MQHLPAMQRLGLVLHATPPFSAVQDETGALREKTSDDYVSMQMRLVPRIRLFPLAAFAPPQGPGQHCHFTASASIQQEYG